MSKSPISQYAPHSHPAMVASIEPQSRTVYLFEIFPDFVILKVRAY